MAYREHLELPDRWGYADLASMLWPHHFSVIDLIFKKKLVVLPSALINENKNIEKDKIGKFPWVVENNIIIILYR